MQTLWLSREDYSVWFDCKKLQEVMGVPKMPSQVEIVLSDKEYEEYVDISTKYFNIQDKLNVLVHKTLRD